MEHIDRITRMVGLSAEDRRLIRAHHQPLADALAEHRGPLEDWMRETGLWPFGESPFIEGCLASLIAGEYGESFSTVQYHQALFWRRHDLRNSHALTVLSRLRQLFVEHAERWEALALGRALCRVIDSAQAVHAVVHHLGYQMERLEDEANTDIRRMQQGCGVLLSQSQQSAAQAYIDHQEWKIAAYSLALGREELPDNYARSPRACRLGRWLYQEGGIEEIPVAFRPGFEAAHERLHGLMAQAIEESRDGQPQRIAEYLVDVEGASEEITEVLGEIIECAMHELVTQDPLTGLNNRRTFENDLQRRIAFSRRRGFPFGLFILDIDHFKTINDRHGHAIGDEVLEGLAHRLGQLIRAEDRLYRWGGEEFAVLAFIDAHRHARDVGERLRRGIAQKPIDTRTGELPITVSVGGAVFDPAVTEGGLEIFGAADRNLYRAKAAGRDRTIVEIP